MADPILERWQHRLTAEPGRPLVVSPDRRHVVRAEEIEHLASSLAKRLEELPGRSIVALSLPNGVGFLAGLLASRKASQVALLLDPRTPSAERQRVSERLLATAMLVTDAAFPRRADDFELRPVGVDFERLARTPLPDDTAVVKVTSGSTGEPRGALVPSRSLVADESNLSATMGVTADDRILASIPMSHSYGLSSVALPCLLRGSALVVPDASDPLGALKAVAGAAVSLLPTVPAFLTALTRSERPRGAAPDLRLVVSAGAPLPPETARRFRELYNRGVRVFYGSSETGGITFDRQGGAGERGTLGTPVENVEVEVLSEDGAEGGAIVVRSDAVATGYWPIPDERLDGGRFETADLGRWRDGELEYLGRSDDVIVVKGKKVFPREIERALLELPGVSDAVVLAQAQRDSQRRVIRAVLETRGERLAPAEVRAWCLQRLSEHKVPRQIDLVDRLPRTPRGKIDRRALCEPRDVVSQT